MARDDNRLVTIVGTLVDLAAGEAVVLQDWWVNDAKHGRQFRVRDYRTALPATLQGLKRYLGTGLIKGIGPVNAGRIVGAFGEATFAVIDTSSERLTEVPSIGPIRTAKSERGPPASAPHAGTGIIVTPSPRLRAHCYSPPEVIAAINCCARRRWAASSTSSTFSTRPHGRRHSGSSETPSSRS